MSFLQKFSFFERFVKPRSSSTQETQTKSHREQWGNNAAFLLAVTGYCVGQGAFTRFPYVCMKNGGGAFLIPFLIAMITVSAPVTYLEMLLGQFSGQSALTVWSFSPACKGIGYTIVLLSIIYAPMYMQYPWATYYFAASFNYDLPWRTCNNEWNSEDCKQVGIMNSTVVNQTKVSSASEEYWNYNVLGISSGIEEIGHIRWKIALINLFCWATVFLCTMKGAQSTGKVVLVTATLPFILVLALVIRGVTLEGSFQGLVYFFKPDMSKLASADVWLEGVIQGLFQTGIGWGGLITMASFNKFHRPSYWDAFLLNFLNCLFTILGGIAVFSVFGFMANHYNVPIGDVATAGPGLAFVAYPEALTQMPFPQFWSAAFFLTLMTVAIDSLFGTFEIIVSGLMDTFPIFREQQVLTTAVLALIMYCCSLLFCTQAAMYLYQIIDWYGFTLPFLSSSFFECIIICYVYGIKRFFSDVKLMFGSSPCKPIAFSWMVLAPLSILVVTVCVLLKLERPTYDFTNFSYPDWSVALGVGIGIVCCLPTPIVFIYALTTTPGNFKEKFVNAFKPGQKWIPNCPDLVEDYRKCWYGVEQQEMPETQKENEESVAFVDGSTADGKAEVDLSSTKA